MAAADDLRANLIGAWTLQSYVSMSIERSNVVYPLGVDARGLNQEQRNWGVTDMITWTPVVFRRLDAIPPGPPMNQGFPCNFGAATGR